MRINGTDRIHDGDHSCRVQPWSHCVLEFDINDMARQIRSTASYPHVVNVRAEVGAEEIECA